MKQYPFTISVKPTYLKDQSEPEDHTFYWSYDIVITNESEEIVQLLNRTWRITDMTGHVEVVNGAGVVGLQPIIKPGKSFTYQSYCELNTPCGTMEGHYIMQDLGETLFEVEIPKFILSATGESMEAYRDVLH